MLYHVDDVLKIPLFNHIDASEEITGFYKIGVKRKFDVDLLSFTLFAKETEYPALLIMNTNGLNTKEMIEFTFLTEKWQHHHGYRDDVHIITIGQTKDQQVYKWNTVMPGQPGDL